MDELRMYQVDDQHHLLFRGDSGLPMGMLPISPYARRLLWQGYSLQKALATCSQVVDNYYVQDLENTGFLQRTLLEFTEVNHFKNPFTSTTDNIKRALWYATRQHTTDRGYISILWLEEARCTQFRHFADTKATHAENEYGIDGLILPDEIQFQIPIKAIDTQFYLSSKMSNIDMVSHFLSTYTKKEFLFKPADKQILSCPICHTALSDYLCEVLGFDSNALQEFFPETSESSKRAKSPLALNQEEFYLYFKTLTLYGMVVRCSNCSQYIYLPERLNFHPLKIIEQTFQEKSVTLKMRNVSDEGICYVMLRASFMTNGKRAERFYDRNLRLSSEDLIFAEIGLPLSKNILIRIFKNILYRRIKHMHNQINKNNGSPVIQPGEEIIYTIDLDYEPITKSGFELSVHRVHFMSGRSWQSSVY